MRLQELLAHELKHNRGNNDTDHDPAERQYRKSEPLLPPMPIAGLLDDGSAIDRGQRGAELGDGVGWCWGERGEERRHEGLGAFEVTRGGGAGGIHGAGDGDAVEIVDAGEQPSFTQLLGHCERGVEHNAFGRHVRLNGWEGTGAAQHAAGGGDADTVEACGIDAAQIRGMEQDRGEDSSRERCIAASEQEGQA